MKKAENIINVTLLYPNQFGENGLSTITNCYYSNVMIGQIDNAINEMLERNKRFKKEKLQTASHIQVSILGESRFWTTKTQKLMKKYKGKPKYCFDDLFFPNQTRQINS